MESRMMNYGMRMYDPTLGRFLSVDPLWQGFRSLSPYQYAYNSPLSYKDPTGLAPQKEQGEKVLYQAYGTRAGLGSAGGLFQDKYFLGEDFDNFAYGVAARSYGISQTIALLGAGAFGIYNGSSKDFDNIYLIDNKRDSYMKKLGYAWRKQK